MVDSDEVRRAKLKVAATLRAQINYKHSLEKIDFRLDVIEPTQRQVAKEVVTLGVLPEFTADVDGVVVDESTDGEA